MQELSPASLAELTVEVRKARIKFPSSRHNLAAATEELGELAEALLQGQGPDRVKEESLHLACVAMRIYEEGDPEFDNFVEGEESDTIKVSKAALVSVLEALVGPSHMVRELQVTRNLTGFDNPINTLIEQYKAQQ